MRILVATDAWHPQINGVVRTLTSIAEAGRKLGADFVFLTPDDFRCMPLPYYPEIKAALPFGPALAGKIAALEPDAIHIATEGPIGLAVRSYCRARNLRFTTSFHTRFPEYVSARVPVPENWVWAYLRWFHNASSTVMVPTLAVARELEERNFRRIVHWSRGVNTNLFYPRANCDLRLPRPVFLAVGRVAVEKNLEAFLSLDLPGSKVVVGDGPARAALMKRYPGAVFLGMQEGEALAEIYAAADAFVFPSRTDTFGLVLLEALASGLPVAAFPVACARDILGASPVGALDEDLRAACLSALTFSREACRKFALGWSWENSAKRFLAHVTDSTPSAPDHAFGFESQVHFDCPRV